MKNLYLIIGAPGSGKTTDAELIAKANPHITHYSTGDMLRAEVANKSEMGKKIESYISKGLIVPIDIAIKTITDAIKKAPTDTVVLDGYPRSMEQLNALEDHLNDDLNLVSVIEVQVSHDTAYQRVVGRNRGADDDTEVFQNRMKIYLEPLKDIQNFYKNKNILQTVSGEQSIEDVVADMQKLIDI